MLAELAGAGEAFVTGGADMTFAAVSPRAALDRLGDGRAGAGSGAVVGPRLTRQRGDAAHRLHSAEALLDTAAGAGRAQRHVLQLGGQLRHGRRYVCLRRGGRAFPARLLELGALRTFGRGRWRTGHLALIFDALPLYRSSGITRRARYGSAVALARRDGRKHFCHIDGLEALFRIRVTCFSRNFWYLSLVST